MSVVFYVSGHGFGHASRTIEVINALVQRRPGLGVTVRTPAPPWFFELTLRASAKLDPADCDPGVVQRDSLEVDEEATMHRAAAFYADLPRRAAVEAACLRERRAALVVCDIAPLGCAAARRAGVPAFVLANFTWDWIYAAYGNIDTTPAVIDTIRAAYGEAEAAWRLPFSAGFDAFQRVVDVPCIARHASRGRADTRRLLSLPAGGRVALASFGGYGLDRLDEDALSRLTGWTVLLTGLRAGPAVSRRGAVLRLDERALYASGFRYEDLVAASDAVVTKPGYGIVGECAANGAALVYTSRGRFPEYDVLIRQMPRYVRCAFIGQGDLLAGRWEGALQNALGQPPPPERLVTSGADAVAGLILDRLGS